MKMADQQRPEMVVRQTFECRLLLILIQEEKGQRSLPPDNLWNTYNSNS